MGPRPLDPQVHSRRLRAELRRAREDAGLSRRQVAEELDWSLSKLVRIETGVVGVSTTDLLALLQRYGVSADERDALLADARASRRPTWWRRFEDILSPDFIAYLGYEMSATTIRQFHTVLLPGLLQAEGYGRAVIEATRGSTDLDRRWEARRHRQSLLDQPDPPPMHFIIDEAALVRPVGGADVMLEQLRHLRKLAQRPTVTVQVIPFEAGGYRGLNGPFVLLEVADEMIVYVETPNGGLLSRDHASEAASYREVFTEMGAAATDVSGPTNPLNRAITAMERAAGHGDSRQRS